MEPPRPDKLVWGWLRLFLGIAQMLLVTVSLVSLLTLGLQGTTWILLVAATVTTLTSRVLYRDTRTGR
jgi:hypothetical protein